MKMGSYLCASEAVWISALTCFIAEIIYMAHFAAPVHSDQGKLSSTLKSSSVFKAPQLDSPLLCFRLLPSLLMFFTGTRRPVHQLGSVFRASVMYFFPYSLQL